jgi:phosphatidylinositol alpha-1,6-mannosyltransferase
MKILLIGNYYYPEHVGGVENVSFNLTKYYKKFGHEVRWIAADVPPNFRDIREGDVPIKSWNFTEEKLGFPGPIPYPEVFSKLYGNIKWCDVVHLQDSLYLINILAFLISKLFGKPVLLTQYAKIIPYHQLYKRVFQSAAYLTIGRIMFRAVNKLVFITANVRDGMSHINPGAKYEIVPLGVDTDFYAPVSRKSRELLRRKINADSSKPIILFVGRMVERKGVHLIRPIIEHHEEWHWVLVGRPDDYNPAGWPMMNLTYVQNVSENELRDLYASADLLVHPSSGEGITLTISECMACGTPVVVSAESLHNVEDKDRALFYPVSTETADIEDALVRALNDHQRLVRHRQESREYAVERMSWEKVSEQYLGILNKLVLQVDS